MNIKVGNLLLQALGLAGSGPIKGNSQSRVSKDNTSVMNGNPATHMETGAPFGELLEKSIEDIWSEPPVAITEGKPEGSEPEPLPLDHESQGIVLGKTGSGENIPEFRPMAEGEFLMAQVKDGGAGVKVPENPNRRVVGNRISPSGDPEKPKLATVEVMNKGTISERPLMRVNLPLAAFSGESGSEVLIGESVKPHRVTDNSQIPLDHYVQVRIKNDGLGVEAGNFQMEEPGVIGVFRDPLDSSTSDKLIDSDVTVDVPVQTGLGGRREVASYKEVEPAYFDESPDSDISLHDLNKGQDMAEYGLGMKTDHAVPIRNPIVINGSERIGPGSYQPGDPSVEINGSPFKTDVIFESTIPWDVFSTEPLTLARTGTEGSGLYNQGHRVGTKSRPEDDIESRESEQTTRDKVVSASTDLNVEAGSTYGSFGFSDVNGNILGPGTAPFVATKDSGMYREVQGLIPVPEVSGAVPVGRNANVTGADGADQTRIEAGSIGQSEPYVFRTLSGPSPLPNMEVDGILADVPINQESIPHMDGRSIGLRGQRLQYVAEVGENSVPSSSGVLGNIDEPGTRGSQQVGGSVEFNPLPDVRKSFNTQSVVVSGTKPDAAVGIVLPGHSTAGGQSQSGVPVPVTRQGMRMETMEDPQSRELGIQSNRPRDIGVLATEPNATMAFVPTRNSGRVFEATVYAKSADATGTRLNRQYLGNDESSAIQGQTGGAESPGGFVSQPIARLGYGVDAKHPGSEAQASVVQGQTGEVESPGGFTSHPVARLNYGEETKASKIDSQSSIESIGIPMISDSTRETDFEKMVEQDIPFVAKGMEGATPTREIAISDGTSQFEHVTTWDESPTLQTKGWSNDSGKDDKFIRPVKGSRQTSGPKVNQTSDPFSIKPLKGYQVVLRTDLTAVKVEPLHFDVVPAEKEVTVQTANPSQSQGPIIPTPDSHGLNPGMVKNDIDPGVGREVADRMVGPVHGSDAEAYVGAGNPLTNRSHSNIGQFVDHRGKDDTEERDNPGSSTGLNGNPVVSEVQGGKSAGREFGPNKENQNGTDREQSRNDAATSEVSTNFRQAEKVLAKRQILQHKEMVVELRPVGIGNMKVAVSLDGTEVNTRIEMGNKPVGEALKVGMGELREALGSQGLELGSLSVSNGGAGTQYHPGGNGQAGTFWNRQGKRTGSSYKAGNIEPAVVSRRSAAGISILDRLV